MKIINTYPPNIREIRKFFPVHDRVVFTWGDKIFNYHNLRIDPGLMKHEEEHSKQQLSYGWILLPDSFKIKRWWHRYLRDSEFRLSQEIPAYQAQFREYKKVILDKNRLHKIAMDLAFDLSSLLYGSIISFDKALKLIKCS